jgi:hypothetical protein
MEISFPNWTADNLPLEIKGRTLWTDHTDPHQSVYYICICKYHYPVEYINKCWYHISWDAGTYHTKGGREITQHLEIRLGTKGAPYLNSTNIECIHLKKSDDTEPITELKTNTEPNEDQDTPIITCQESQIIDQLANIMSTTTIVNVSMIPQGTTGLSQVTTAPPQSKGRSGPPGGGTPPGQPAGGGPPPGPPGGGGGPPAKGPLGGAIPAPAAATVPNLPGIQNGVLKGAMPTTFDGNRTKTNQFIWEFSLYQVINLNNVTIVSPFRYVALALTFMRRPKVDDWVVQYIDLVGTKVYGNNMTNPLTPATHQFNDECLWTEFIADFCHIYSDTAEAEGAYAKLMILSMKDGDGQLNNYIAKFETLLCKAHWEHNTQGVVDLFKQGLKLNLHHAILCWENLPCTLNKWIWVACLEAKWMALIKASLGPMGGGNITTCQNQLCAVHNPTKTRGSKKKDPDVIEVNTVHTDATCTNCLSDEEKQCLLKEGQCFNCKKLGHMTYTCPNKQRAGRNTNWQGGQTMTPSHPAQSTSHMRTAIINEDEEDVKEGKGKEKEDALPTYKPKSLIEYIKQLNAMDCKDLLEHLALNLDFWLVQCWWPGLGLQSWRICTLEGSLLYMQTFLSKHLSSWPMRRHYLTVAPPSPKMMKLGWVCVKIVTLF